MADVIRTRPDFRGSTRVALMRGEEELSRTLIFPMTLRVGRAVGKGRLAEGKTDARPVIQLDVLPTALAAAGLKASSSWRLDGVDLLPFLTRKSRGEPHETLYWRLGENMAIRKGDWKLVKTHEGRLRADSSLSEASLSGAELYNLADDIGERTNRATANPGKVKELAAAWLEWNKDLPKPLWGPPRRAGPPSTR